MEADIEQLSQRMFPPPRGGPSSFRIHQQYNFNFLIISSNSTIPHDMFRTQSSKGSSYRKKLHAVIMFLITAFGGYVQVLYQSKMKSPYDDHGTIMAAIFVGISLYALSLIAEYSLPNENSYLRIIKTFGPLLGFLVHVLLLMVLVPLLGTIASIIWALFVVKASILWFSRMLQYLRQLISGIIPYSDVSEPSDSLEVV